MINNITNENSKDIQIFINQKVIELREKIIQYNPLELLQYAQGEFLQNFIGVLSEREQMEIEQYIKVRFVSYVQSVFVSTKIDKNKMHSIDYNGMTTLLKDFKEIYIYINQYYFTCVAEKSKIQNEKESQIYMEMLESQIMYDVRGKRYQVFQKEYLELLLFPHNDELVKTYKLTALEVVEGIMKLEYALSSKKIDKLNEIRKTYYNCNFNLNHANILKDIISLDDNNVYAITGWNKNFIKSLSYEIGEFDCFFNKTEFPGWPNMELPIFKKPFICIDNTFYCFDYYSLMDNIYRAIQRILIDNNCLDEWQKNQKIASESAVGNVFSKILPNSKIYYDNYYPITQKSKKQMNENDVFVFLRIY